MCGKYFKRNKCSGMVVSWGNNITRSTSLAKVLGFDDFHVRPTFKLKYLKLINYIVAFLRSLWKILVSRPRELVLVGPPTFIFYAIPIIKCFLSETRVTCDFHNGVLRYPWAALPGLKRCIREADLVLSHNGKVKDEIDVFFGVNSRVLTDPLPAAHDTEGEVSSSHVSKIKLNVLVPCSFSIDEPVELILDLCVFAAKKFNLIVTGDYNKIRKREGFKHAFGLANFTGFLPKEKYRHLLASSDVVLCLTNDDSVQMCASNEALGFSKLLLHSNTPVLNGLYSGKELAVDHSVCSIVSAIERLDARKEYWQMYLGDVREFYQSRWHRQFESVFSDGERSR